MVQFPPGYAHDVALQLHSDAHVPACSKPSPSGKTPILTKPAVIAAIRNCLSDEYFIREERLVQRVAAQLLCQNFRQRATVQKIVAELPASCEDFERKWVRENGSSNGQRLYYYGRVGMGMGPVVGAAVLEKLQWW